MKVNLYDFDKTIYDGDSSIDFFMFCLRKKIVILKYLPKQILYIFLYKIKRKNKTEMKEVLFSYLKDLIASDVDKKTGKFNDQNCYGEEKVRRLKEKYPNIKINEAYSDSMSDYPLFDIANDSYIVKKNKLIKYTKKFSENK